MKNLLLAALVLTAIVDGTTTSAAPSYKLIDLGTLGGAISIPFPACCPGFTPLNGSGQVTGYSMITGNTAQHAFLWNGTSMQSLGTLGGSCAA